MNETPATVFSSASGGCSLEILQALRLKVVEASPDAKIVINRHGSILDLNEEAEYLFGYARGDLIGKPIETLIPSSAAENHKGYVKTFFQTPKRREMGAGMILNGLNRDGEEFRVKLKLAPLVIEGDDGGIFGLAVVRRVETT